MPPDVLHNFYNIWMNAKKEDPPNPLGAAGELMSALEEALDVEVVEYGKVESAALFLLDLSPLGLKGMDMNVVMVTHPPADDERAKQHARLIAEYKDAVQSIGFCFHILLQDDEPDHNRYVPSSLEAVYICGGDLERLFSAKVPSAALFDIIRRQVSLQQLCPFNTNREARGSMFKGRADEVRSLVYDLDNNYVLTGARRIGKTSLLKRAQSVLHTNLDTRDRSFYFDCINWGDYWDCAHRLAIKIEPKKDPRLQMGARNFAYLLQRKSMGGTHPLLLFFDECDRLVDSERAGNWELIGLLKEATNNKWIRVAFAGFRSVQQISTSNASPFFGAIKEIRADPLSGSEARGLLSDPFTSMGIPLREPDRILDKVQKSSAGHPFLVQFYGERLFGRAMERSPQEVLPGDVEEIEEGFELSNFLKSHFLWNTLKSDGPSFTERLCAVVYALQGNMQEWAESDFLDTCRSYSDTDVTVDGVHMALTNLYYSCLLRFRNGRYSFTFPLLKDTIAQLYPSVDALLKDLEGR